MHIYTGTSLCLFFSQHYGRHLYVSILNMDYIYFSDIEEDIKTDLFMNGVEYFPNITSKNM